jgi:hypothetical protein
MTADEARIYDLARRFLAAQAQGAFYRRDDEESLRRELLQEKSPLVYRDGAGVLVVWLDDGDVVRVQRRPVIAP